jgi:hypothetical protein
MNNARPKADRWNYLNDLRDIIKLHPNWVQGFIDGRVARIISIPAS